MISGVFFLSKSNRSNTNIVLTLLELFLVGYTRGKEVAKKRSVSWLLKFGGALKLSKL